jgi:hypothetical protein
VNFQHRVVICTCEHHKLFHVISKAIPAGPCELCLCVSFTPEPVCKCGHGKKAHQKSPSNHCHECGCKEFRRKEEAA